MSSSSSFLLPTHSNKEKLSLQDRQRMNEEDHQQQQDDYSIELAKEEEKKKKNIIISIQLIVKAVKS